MKPPKNFYSNLDRRKQGLPELPEASASDVGKIVKVGSGGAYELGQDAGAKVLAITLASDFTANKTYTEILASLNNGDIVKLTDWTGRNYIYSGMTSGRICFAYLNGYVNTNESDVYTIAVDDTNTWNMFLDTITHLPNVSSSDVGKVLGVDSNGAWGAENIPKELPSVTSADVGKVLTVDIDGKWEVDKVPEKIMIVNIDAAWQITDNITILDINRAIIAGKSVYLRQDSGELFPFVGVGRATSAATNDWLCFTKTNILYLTDHYALNIRTLAAKRTSSGKTFTITQSNITLTV